MFRARIKDSGRVVFAAQIADEPAWYTAKRPLICFSCAAGVHGKSTYVKRNGASYRAHFALNPKSSHEATCPLNPIEFITSIAHGAQDLAYVEDGILKLALPGDVEDLAPSTLAVSEAPPLPVTGKIIDTVPPPLPPLLNCAAKIARFLQANAFDDKVVRRFRVQPHGHTSTIPWGRFCYGPSATAYGELVQRLDPDGTGSAPSHPVAVYGTVQRVHYDRAGRPFVFLADHTDLDGREFEVVLRSMHPSLIEPLAVGTHVLAVGTWGTFPDGRVPQLRLFADEAWQIAYWHTDENTGVATQPVSPPAVTAYQRAAERPARSTSNRTTRPTKAGQRPTSPPGLRPAPSHTTPTWRAPAAPSAAPSAAPLDAPQPLARPESGTDAHSATPDVTSVGSPAGQPIPPSPSRPPLPAPRAQLPPSRRRKGLPGWLGRRKKRQG